MFGLSTDVDKLVTVKCRDVSSVSPSLLPVTKASAFESLYAGQFTLSYQLR